MLEEGSLRDASERIPDRARARPAPVARADLKALNGHRSIGQARTAERGRRVDRGAGGRTSTLRRRVRPSGSVSAVGEGSATVRVAVPDAAGRLRVIACDGQHEGLGSDAFLAPQDGVPDRRRSTLPIQGPRASRSGSSRSCRTTTCSGRRDRRPDGQDRLARGGRACPHRAGGARVGYRARPVADGASARGDDRDLAAGPELLEAKTATEAVRVTVGVCFEYLAVARRRGAARSRRMGMVPRGDRWSRLRGDGRSCAPPSGPVTTSSSRTARRSRPCAGGSGRSPDAERSPSLRAGVRRSWSATRRSRRSSSSIGRSRCWGPRWRQSSVSRRARARNQARDLGIALTAHELKGPLVGARAAIERAYETHAGDEGRELLAQDPGGADASSPT